MNDCLRCISIKEESKGTLRIAFLLLVCAVALVAQPASAQDSRWTLRGGPVGVFWDESATVKLNGQKVPGADGNVKNNTSFAIDIGYDLTDRWTMHLGVGVPPKTKLTTAGSLNQARPPLSGKLGEVRYGPAVLSAVYKFNPNGRIVPYVGAGVTYVHVFSSKDGDIEDLDVDDAWGGLLQIGFNVPLQKNWSFFVDARKLFVDTKAKGTLPALGGPPVSASIDLDPLIVHTGLEYRF